MATRIFFGLSLWLVSTSTVWSGPLDCLTPANLAIWGIEIPLLPELPLPPEPGGELPELPGLPGFPGFGLSQPNRAAPDSAPQIAPAPPATPAPPSQSPSSPRGESAPTPEPDDEHKSLFDYAL